MLRIDIDQTHLLIIIFENIWADDERRSWEEAYLDSSTLLSPTPNQGNNTPIRK